VSQYPNRSGLLIRTGIRPKRYLGSPPNGNSTVRPFNVYAMPLAYSRIFIPWILSVPPGLSARHTDNIMTADQCNHILDTDIVRDREIYRDSSETFCAPRFGRRFGMACAVPIWHRYDTSQHAYFPPLPYPSASGRVTICRPWHIRTVTICGACIGMRASSLARECGGHGAGRGPYGYQVGVCCHVDVDVNVSVVARGGRPRRDGRRQRVRSVRYVPALKFTTIFTPHSVR